MNGLRVNKAAAGANCKHKKTYFKNMRETEMTNDPMLVTGAGYK
jgi:hypothetical protein